MAYMLNNIDEAVDRKFLVTKNRSNQAKAGTLVHIMGADDSSGVKVNYRVTDTGQDFTIDFDTLNDFGKWAMPDSFIARYYEQFNNKEILHYIKVQCRTFASFCLPIIIGVAVVAVLLGVALTKTFPLIWAISGVLIVGGIVGSIMLQKKAKSSIKLKLYRKVSSNWGIDFK